MIKPSLRFTLNKADLIAWSKNALVFAGPALLVFIGSVIQAVPADWKYAVITIYVLNRLTDFLRRYLQGKAK